MMTEEQLRKVIEASGIILERNKHVENLNKIFLAVLEDFEVQCKEDGIWLVLHGKGTHGQAAFNLGNGQIALQVAAYFEEDRRRAVDLAKGQP